MNIRTKLTLLITVVAAIGLFPAAHSPANETWAQKRESNQPRLSLAYASSGLREAAQTTNKREAKPGDVASGSVVDAPGVQLYLNIRPCEGETFIVVFHQPYSRSTRGQKNCRGQAVTIEQIQQN